MTIFLSVLLAVFIVAFGVVLRLYLNERRYHAFALSARHHLRLAAEKEVNKRVALEREIGVLRSSNRSSLKAWQAERRELWTKVRASERHAKEMQAFHLHNEQDLNHELAGAHALIELLMMAVPKGDVISHPHEVRRLFRPVSESRPKINRVGEGVKYPDAGFMF